MYKDLWWEERSVIVLSLPSWHNLCVIFFWLLFPGLYFLESFLPFSFIYFFFSVTVLQFLHDFNTVYISENWYEENNQMQFIPAPIHQGSQKNLNSHFFFCHFSMLLQNWDNFIYAISCPALSIRCKHSLKTLDIFETIISPVHSTKIYWALITCLVIIP